MQERPATDLIHGARGVGTRTAKRSPAVAFLLSLFVPGLGQIYNTQARRGVVCFGAWLLLAPLLFALPVGLHPLGLGVVLVALIVFRPLVAFDAAKWSRRIGAVELRSFNRVGVYMLAGVAAILLSWGRTPVVEALRRVELFRIPTESMMPTLMPGDFVAADRGAVEAGVEPGALIVFQAPVPERELFIQRVIATGGDIVQVRRGVLFVNRRRAATSLQGSRRSAEVRPSGTLDPNIVPPGAGNADNYGPVVVPRDSLFILGDSRDNSIDSRYYGFVSDAAVQSAPRYVLLSWDYSEGRPRWERFGIELD